jgi:hypothetical protein
MAQLFDRFGRGWLNRISGGTPISDRNDSKSLKFREFVVSAVKIVHRVKKAATLERPEWESTLLNGSESRVDGSLRGALPLLGKRRTLCQRLPG